MSYRDRDRVYAWLDAGNGDGLTTLDRAVLVMIAERANGETGVSAPGNDDPAARWGVQPNSIDRSISRLRRAGLVEIVRKAYGRKNARLILAGDVARPAESSSTDGLSYSTEIAQPKPGIAQPVDGNSSTDGLSVLSKSSSRGSTEGMMIGDGAGADAPAAALEEEVADRLGVSVALARQQIATWLAGAKRPPRDVVAYVRACLRNAGDARPAGAEPVDPDAPKCGAVADPECEGAATLGRVDDDGREVEPPDRWCATCWYTVAGAGTVTGKALQQSSWLDFETKKITKGTRL